MSINIEQLRKSIKSRFQLLYGCEIWGVCLLGKISSFELFQKKFLSVVNKMESLQLKFFKRILGVHSKSANLAVYG